MFIHVHSFIIKNHNFKKNECSFKTSLRKVHPNFQHKTLTISIMNKSYFFLRKHQPKIFQKEYTAEPAYGRLQGNKEYCLLKEKSTITGIDK